jgi:hypothetical protein
MVRIPSIRFVLLCLGLFLFLMSAPLTQAHPLPMPLAQGVLTNCTGEYFNNTTITGAPVLTRTDAAINFFWPENTSPAPDVNPNNYSVRWTCSINVTTASNVTFNVTTDDGMNVLVDGNLILWAFYDQGPTAYTATTSLAAGAHTVRIEYYNRWNAGTAIVSSTASPGPAPSPITPIPPAPPAPTGVWQGQYFNNMTLSGSPTYVRNDPTINFNWGETAIPAPGIPHNYFSVRWTSTQNLPATGDYTITATSDDGVRVWVDGALVIDGWSNHPPITYTATRNLTAGAHSFQVEYYQLDYGAMIVVQITQGGVSPGPGPSPSGVWRGNYFNNITCSGAPVYVRDDPVINFNWGETGIPAPGVPHDNFCVRWDSTQNLPTGGDYTISATSDDGVRVWVDGSLAVDGWFDHGPATFTTIRNLSAGAHNFTVEYYNRYLGAMVVVQVYQGTTPSPIPPVPPYPGEIIVDDGGPGWQAGGTFAWYHAPVGIGNHSFWAQNVAYTASGYNWARWHPTLPAPGNYEVSAYIPAGVATTLNARYWIYHSGQYVLAARAQGLAANQWVSLGTYYFSAQGNEFVSLATVTYECYLCRTVVFDAVKFTPR